jgi:Carboxypeptidase regulatory-like domain
VRIQRIWLVILGALAVSASLKAQDRTTSRPEKGRITGTAIDPNDHTIPGATTTLEGPLLTAPLTVISDDHGFFEFTDVDPGTYTVGISAKGFAKWTSAPLTLKPGQYLILTGSVLKIKKEVTTVSVAYSPVEVATEEVKIEEQQRVLGIIPNFYVDYDQNATPLTTKLKFQLAVKVSTDAVTIVGIGVLAAIYQAGDVPNYPQGFKGYGQRVGAVAADSLSDIMIGGAILPSLLHQDPRYFYQGTGTNKSRAFHALSSPFVCKGDNGRPQPNYSSIGGDLASAVLSNAYYPASDRGVRQTFQNLIIGTGERMVGSVLQEFVLPRLTRRGKNK